MFFSSVLRAPASALLPMAGIRSLVTGGVVYTAGIAFFALSKHVAHTDGLWHVVVR